MGLQSTFQISAVGDPLPGKDIAVFVRRMSAAISRVDPGVKYDLRHFAGIRYRVVWSGNPIYLEKIDDVQKIVKRYSKEYLAKWEYSININYVERGG